MTAYIFNSNSLVAEVKERYNARQAGTPLSKATIETLYPPEAAGPRTGIQNYFHAQEAVGGAAGAQALERFITNDGTLFLVRNVNYATVQKLSATKLTENTAVGVQKWYENLTRTLHDHGVYVHPFWAFRTQCDHR